MQHFYAQLDGDGIAYAITQTSGAIDAVHLVPLPSLDTGVLGKRWTGTHWQAVAPSEVLLPKHITKRAFRDRFTKPERVAIEWASVDRADATLAERQMAAALRSDLKDQEQAVYINLDDPDVAEGLQQLASFGLVEPHRPAEILTAPVQDHERPTT